MWSRRTVLWPKRPFVVGNNLTYLGIRSSHHATVKLGTFLSKYGTNLTKLAAEGRLDPVIGRDNEIHRALQILLRRKKNNPCLVGEPGVGKTAIAEGMAYRIAMGEVPESMKSSVIVSLDLASMLAGAKFRGEFEERLKGVLKDIEQAGSKIILFIDEIHSIVGAGAAEGAIDASNILKPPLARGLLRCMGATTTEEYRKYIEKDAALARRFQTILVDEPSMDDTVEVLRGLRTKYEIHHGVAISEEALVAATKLSDRYITDRRRPDKAIDLIDEAASQLRMQLETRPAAVVAIEEQLTALGVAVDSASIHCATTPRTSAAATATTDGGTPTTEGSAQQSTMTIITDSMSSPQEHGITTVNPTDAASVSLSSAAVVAIDPTAQALLDKRSNILSRWQEVLSILHKVNDKRVLADGFRAQLLQAKKAARLQEVRRLEELELAQVEEMGRLEQGLRAHGGAAQEKNSVGVQTTDNMSDMPAFNYTVTAAEVASIVANSTGIPVGSLLEEEKQNLLNMETVLGEQVIGQEPAIAAIAKCIRLSRAGLRYHDRPLGVFLMLGPTGVGKTELAKALSQFLFQDTDAMIRIDMSEYMEKFSVSRLVGAPPGYVGYEEGGVLTEAVRRRPYQVVLFDEFEKAHREVSNLLLQVFDEGRLGDSHGHVVDFRNTVVIMTSNIAINDLYDNSAGDGGDEDSGSSSSDSGGYTRNDIKTKDAISKYFAPEFLNRIDEVITFKPLSREVIKSICRQQLVKVKRLLVERGMSVEVDPMAEAWLASAGYDPKYGARPLKRLVQNTVLNPLATMILENKLASGSEIVVSVEVSQLCSSADYTILAAPSVETAAGTDGGLSPLRFYARNASQLS